MIGRCEKNSVLMKFVADMKLEALPKPINIAKIIFKRKLEKVRFLKKKKGNYMFNLWEIELSKYFEGERIE